MKDDPRNGTTSADAKAYLSKRQVPQLFEGLMTGLMYNQPEDHIQFLVDCLLKVKEDGQQAIVWNMFVDMKPKAVLPPLGGRDDGRGNRTGSNVDLKRDAGTIKEKPKGALGATADTAGGQKMSKLSPLPPIAAGSYSVPQCPVIMLFGAPGSGRHSQGRMLYGRYGQNGWALVSMGDILEQAAKNGQRLADDKAQSVQKLIADGAFVDEDTAVKLLLEQVSAKSTSGGIIIEGFPRSVGQLEAYSKAIGRLDIAILLDCTEEQCIGRLTKSGYSQARITTSLELFKKETLPAAYSIDKLGKLAIIHGDRDSVQVFRDICAAIENALKAGGAGAAIKNLVEVEVDNSLLTVTTLDMHVVDEGRRPSLPKCPLVLVFGGPGSDRANHCQMLAQRYPGWLHISTGKVLRSVAGARARGDQKWATAGMQISQGLLVSDESALQAVLNELNLHHDAEGIILEGYPRNQRQLEDFYRNVGGPSLIIVLDCTEESMLGRLSHESKDNSTPEVATTRLGIYKAQTLPVIKYLDIHGKLVLLHADRDTAEVHGQLSQLFDDTFHASDGAQPVIEDIIEAKTAAQTGEEDHTIPKGQPEAGAVAAMAPVSGSSPLEGKLVIFVVGGPGCGKGTQCDKIVQKYGFCHLSSGDLLRAEVSSGSARGTELNKIMESGALVSLDVVLQLLKEAMLNNTEAKGFLIDGYPRELEQGTKFEQQIVSPKAVLYFEVSDEVMTQRLLGRAQTSGRVDDNIDTIKKRLTTFHQHSDAVLDYYKSNGLLHSIPATGTVDSIFAEVEKIIDGL